MAAPSKKARPGHEALPPTRATTRQSSRHLTAATFLAAGHVVQFYESDQFLAESIASYFKAGLETGDACLAVATPAHHEQIERQLQRDGLDLDAAHRQGIFLALDAREMLRQFMSDDGVPDAARFNDVVGDQIAQLASGGRHVRVFGEMVALLWAEGNQRGAIVLEELWNDLQAGAPYFSLCCAYPMSGMSGAEHIGCFAQVCERHTHVVPAESYTDQLTPQEQMRAITLLQQRARSLEGEIAHRQSAEERLRASEQRYRLLFETALDGILLVDPGTGRVTDANPAAMDLLGIEREQVIGCALWQIGLFPQSERAAAMLLELREQRTLRYETLPLQRSDSQMRYVELVANCFDTSDGEMIQCTLRDVTGRRHMERRTEEALTALLRMAEALVDSSPAADEPDAPTHASESAHPGVAPHPGVASTATRLAELTRRVLGCEQLSIAAIEPETDRMRPLALVGFSDEQERQWWAGWQPEMTVTERLGAEVAGRLHAGELVTLDVQAPPHRERLAPFNVQALLLVPARIDDKLVGGLALLYDNRLHIEAEHERMLAGAVAQLVGLVIERDRLLREREEARANALALSEANRRMSEFLSIASHELKTPVTVMKANLQLCSRRLRRTSDLGANASAISGANDVHRTLDIARTMIERTEHGADRLVRLVDDLLDATRIQAGKLELRAEPTDLALIAREAVEEQRHANPRRTLRFTSPACQVAVHADRDRIGQVVSNYLTNALKYSPADQPVSVYVDVDRNDAIARVLVRDEGPGLPPEEHGRVWQEFHRAPQVEVLTGSGIGLGLGLHICKTIIEQHGGHVGVESAVGTGSTFWFTLPLGERPS